MLSSGNRVACAGATNLYVDREKGKYLDRDIVSLHRLKELSGIREEKDGWHIGSLTTFDLIEDVFRGQGSMDALAEAASLVGGPQIRNRGTIGGNILSASPAADTAENGTADLDSAVETLLAADPISNQFEIAAMNIEYDFGLKAEDVAAYKGVKSNDNGDAGLVLVVEAASGKAQDVVTALESYKQDQVAFYGNYAEFAQAQSNVENAIISSKGDRVVMVIASNECTADLNSAVNSALNS